MQVQEASLWQIWQFCFLLLGPIKIIGPFARMVQGADLATRHQLAWRAFLFATAIVLLSATLGVVALRGYGIPTPVLALTGGVVLFLVALLSLIEQVREGGSAGGPVLPASPAAAAMPLAYPIIVTPSGVAAVIIFMTVAADFTRQLEIIALLLGLMALNLLAMRHAPTILKHAGLSLMVLGTVLGVVQTALGLNIMLNSLRTLGVLPG